MEETPYRIAPLDEATWPAFAALVEANGGVYGGCWCTAFHARTDASESNEERKHDLVRTGRAHAALVLDDTGCVGWCQFGPPGELPRIKSRAAYEKGAATGADWRIGCCFVGKGHRRQGLFTAALTGALGLIADAGGGVVEGFPEAAADVPAGFLFNGSLSTYEALGFARVRLIGKHRWVVVRQVIPGRAI